MRLVALLIGLGDALTGVALVAMPLAVLARMGIVPPEGAEVWLRFIGAFVAGVGFATVEPAAWPSSRRLAGAMSATLTVRLAVASVVGVAVLRGELATGWWLVAAWDTTAAIIQALMLRNSRDA